MAEIDDETDKGQYCKFWNPRLTKKFHKTNFPESKLINQIVKRSLSLH